MTIESLRAAEKAHILKLLASNLEAWAAYVQDKAPRYEAEHPWLWGGYRQWAAAAVERLRIEHA